MRARGAGALFFVGVLCALGLVVVACPHAPSAPSAALPAPSAALLGTPALPTIEAKTRARESSAPASTSHESAFYSAESCAEALAKRQPSEPRRTARIGTWNVRWFPDGGPGNRPKEPGTDIRWLACAVASLDVDVLAIQEFKALPRAKQRLDELLAELRRLTGAEWKAELDDCPQLATQHTGLVWNTRRAAATALRTQGELNPHGQPCKDSLRPGFGAHFRFGTGQSAHVISVHYKSGAEARSLDLRKTSFLAMAGAVERARSLDPDVDVVFAGDFNTMGCTKCSPAVSAVDERAALGASLQGAGLAFAPTDLTCSEYYGGRGTLLDGFVVTPAQSGRLVGQAHVAGYCADLACRPHRTKEQTAARERLSDHCPVVLELGAE